MTDPTVIRLNADSFAHNTKPALIIFEISKEDINSGNISSALERLHVLTDSVENTRLYRSSLAIMVDGYNNDPRELYEIQEVRKFFQRLTEDWPHWLWFLNPEMGSVELLMSLLCKIRIIRSKNGLATEFVQKTEVVDRLRDMLDRGNILFTTYNIPEEEVIASTKTALRKFMP